MGWVEKLTPSAMQSAPKALCNVCQAKKEKAEKTGAKVDKVADEIMEVDEWGFQMAMDQVAEASCPEDAAAVLEALLKSKPCEDFLKAPKRRIYLSLSFLDLDGRKKNGRLSDG
eukprot:symbB.v1.2.026506.t1/scaffold2654.1/size73885/1